MDSIKDLIGKYDQVEPPEIVAIKRYVNEHFKKIPAVTIQPSSIVIEVTSASLAGALRMHLHQLQQIAQTEKRLIIRIGS